MYNNIVLQPKGVYMKTICTTCGRKITPIFSNHIYNDSESILRGNETIRNGSENTLTGHKKYIYKYACLFCGTKRTPGSQKCIKL